MARILGSRLPKSFLKGHQIFHVRAALKITDGMPILDTGLCLGIVPSTWDALASLTY